MEKWKPQKSAIFKIQILSIRLHSFVQIGFPITNECIVQSNNWISKEVLFLEKF